MAAWHDTSPEIASNFWHGLGWGLLLSALLVIAAGAGIVVLARMLAPILNLG